MDIGRTLGNAGLVGRGWTEAEERERIARANQLVLEEANRQDVLRRQYRNANHNLTPPEIPDWSGEGRDMQVRPAVGVAPPAPPTGPTTQAPPAPPTGPTTQAPPAANGGRLTDQQVRERLAYARANMTPFEYARFITGTGPNAQAYGQYLDAPEQPARAAGLTTDEMELPFGGPEARDWQVAPRDPDTGYAVAPVPPEYQNEPTVGAPPTPSAMPPVRQADVFSPALSDMTYEEFQKLTPTQKRRRLEAENDWRITAQGGIAALKPFATVGDAVHFGVGNGMALLGNLLGLPRVGRMLGMRDPDAPTSFEYSEFGSVGRGPANRAIEQRQPLQSVAELEAALQARDQARAAEAAAEEPEEPEEPEDPTQEVRDAVQDAPRGPITLAAPGGVTTPEVRRARQQAEESPSIHYAMHPKSIIHDRMVLDDDYQRIRANLVNWFEAQRTAGDGLGMRETMAQIQQLDMQYRDQATLLEGHAALYAFEFGGDPRAISDVLSSMTGADINVYPTEDGMWQLDINGHVQGNYTMPRMTDMVRELYDVSYRNTKIASQQETAKIQLENALATNLELTKIQARGLVDTVLKSMDAQIAYIEQEIENEKFKIAIDTNAGLAYVYNEAGTVLGVIDSQQGKTVKTPTGEVQLPPVFRSVAPGQAPVQSRGGRM